MILSAREPLATAVFEAIHSGDVITLAGLLREHPGLATARIVKECGPNTTEERSLLHLATDWPGHFPNVARTIAVLLDAGADPSATFGGAHPETPLHWAASSDDVAALDALLDGGADIEAPGAVLGGGTPLADAVGFGQWQTARRLIERGARAELWQAAGLGLIERVKEYFGREPAPTPDDLTRALWSACHGGQQAVAQCLLARGADLNWVGYGGLTPLDVARQADAGSLIEWLRSQGGKSAKDAN